MFIKSLLCARHFSSRDPAVKKTDKLFLHPCNLCFSGGRQICKSLRQSLSSGGKSYGEKLSWGVCAGWWWIACHSVESMELRAGDLGSGSHGSPLYLRSMGLKGIKRLALVVSRASKMRLWALVGSWDGRWEPCQRPAGAWRFFFTSQSGKVNLVGKDHLILSTWNLYSP